METASQGLLLGPMEMETRAEECRWGPRAMARRGGARPRGPAGRATGTAMGLLRRTGDASRIAGAPPRCHARAPILGRLQGPAPHRAWRLRGPAPTAARRLEEPRTDLA